MNVVGFPGYHDTNSDRRQNMNRTKTIQLSLDINLVKQVEALARRLRTTRSAVARDALKTAIHKIRSKELERQHRRGYARKPVRKAEFGGWESEQVWPN